MSAGTTRPSALISRATLVALGVSGLCALTGCDTVARIGFDKREFQNVRPLGFTSVAGSCDGSEGALRFRTVFLDGKGLPIRPGEEVNQQVANPAEEDISFTSGNLYDLPDVTCGGDGVMCGAAFTCGIGDMVRGDNRCIAEANFSATGDPTFLSDTEKPQLFGVLLENSASLDGFLPEAVGQLSMDFDGDGIAESELDQSQRGGRETDPQRARRQSITSLFTRFIDAHGLATDENRTTGFGLWHFSGTNADAATSLVEEVTPSGSVFTNSLDRAGDARGAYLGVNATKERADVYWAMELVLTEYADPEYDGHEKYLVVFVDGPSDLRQENRNADTIAAAAAEAGVRIVIVHLDPELSLTTSGGTPLFRDDPQYWSGANAQPECASDDDCFNYEECRNPQGFAQTPGQPIGQPTDGTYCFPKRNEEDGRTGPIDGYAQIACATGGGYLYLTDAAALNSNMSWLPMMMDGLWEVPVSLDTFVRGDAPSGSGFKVSTDIGVTLGGTNQPYSFSEGNNAASDTRGVVFSKP